MQTKSSYRLLKWTLLACMTASFASACVVTTGDGDGDFSFDGGEGGTSSNTGGKASSGAGTSSKAGSGGKVSSGGGGATSTAGSGGSGGSGTVYMAALCDADSAELEGPTPSVLADATLNADDEEPANACRKCLKGLCETEWSTCYGTEPRIACGWGDENEQQPGQFDCIMACFEEGAQDPMGTAEELLLDCTAECTTHCEDADNGNVMVHTSEVVECANAACQDECFPF